MCLTRSKLQFQAGVGNRGRGVYPPGWKILKIPPPCGFGKNIPPLGGAKCRRHYFWSKLEY